MTDTNRPDPKRPGQRPAVSRLDGEGEEVWGSGHKRINNIKKPLRPLWI